MATKKDTPVTYFAQTDARAKRVPFGIKVNDRLRHVYVIGKTGMGKSTLLENMAVQDIQSGNGLAFIDPHGASAEKLLDYVPEERLKDVLYFAPFDLQYPISFNVLEQVEADHRHLVVNGLMSTFEKLWADQWSARMAYILQNTLAALLEFPGATLLGVNRMYVDKDYRRRVVESCTDPTVKSFWTEEYAKYTDRYTQEATPAIQNKIGQFQANALVRNIIGQGESSFNLREMMDTRKIFIVNLSKGRVGEGNAKLLGAMLVTKIYLAAMSRADIPASQLTHLPEFHLFVDEFQNFANRSFADILSESRKYKLALTVAHQYIEQMEEEVTAAVFGNVGSMITFRVGAYDAEVLEKEFMPAFTAEDLVNLGLRQIYLKLMIDGVSSPPFSATTLPPIEPPRVSLRDKVIAYSRARYSRPRAEVERDIYEWTTRSFSFSPEEQEKKKEETYRSREKQEDSRREKSPANAARREDRPQSREGREKRAIVPAREISQKTFRRDQPVSSIANRSNVSVKKDELESFDAYTERTYREAYAQKSETTVATPPRGDIIRTSMHAPIDSPHTTESLREVLRTLVYESQSKEDVKRSSEQMESPSSPQTPEAKREDLRAALARMTASVGQVHTKEKKLQQKDISAAAASAGAAAAPPSHTPQSDTAPKEEHPALTPEALRRMMAVKKPKV